MISKIPLRLLSTIQPLKMTRVFAPFCTQLEKVNKTGQKLVKIVEKELKYEKTNYVEDDTAIQFVEKAGFQLVDDEANHEVTLEKKVGDVKVIVQFQSRQPNQDEGEEEEAEEQQKNKQNQEEEEEQESHTEYADFTVYLQKSNGQILCYECSTSQGEVNVNMVSLIKDLEAHKLIPRFERGLQDYSGPDFITLDERLQLALVDYLKGFGINDELGAFIEHYSLDKEQRLYIQWLNSLTTFLKN
ncbi:unnamed protein product (macronuclear) [Paramecium tetraurelia]|uniref:Uncharacterized protein n=1 Tax=Paramecium tetraurelia TaxID=5888 RepID=A0BL04_PARTE|nr:uncharacterized protein GSPATT00029852001 [Paramecium tetraurelia]CAK59221.1 unnamed protein product [Paramecium tetraurelia]|eukprot:XP_001426619.1 hypothetical protein (macronuclear) [Paramecium tetraurelia strain d4-2]